MRWWCRVLTCYTNSWNSYFDVLCKYCTMQLLFYGSLTAVSLLLSLSSVLLVTLTNGHCMLHQKQWVHSSGLNGSQQIPGSLQEYRHWKNCLCFSCMSICKEFCTWSELLHAFIKPRAACTWHGCWCQQGTGMACHTPPSELTRFPDKIRLVLMRFI